MDRIVHDQRNLLAYIETPSIDSALAAVRLLPTVTNPLLQKAVIRLALSVICEAKKRDVCLQFEANKRDIIIQSEATLRDAIFKFEANKRDLIIQYEESRKEQILHFP